MVRQGFVRRHRVAIASNAALVIAVGAVIGYAVSADGYKSHQTELNDGGIWVVHDEEGLYGRINKPINQLDTAVFNDDAGVPLDVLQQGAAVVGFDERSGVASTIDPAESRMVPGMQASLPRDGHVEMYGGTLASLDPATGQLRAVPVDPAVGRPDISRLDRLADPLEKVGAQAALTVTAGGDVVGTSAVERTVVRLERVTGGFGPPDASDLPETAGDPSQATAVGEDVVTLDQAAGILQVLGGPAVEVPEGAVLQQPGPAADSVLVAASRELLEIDLGSGDVTVVTDRASGRPAEPVRLGACVYGAWSGGLGAVVARCGADGSADPAPLGGRSSDLAFRVNRDQIVLNDNTSGAVWDLDEKPVRIDNWEAFTSTKLVDAKNKKDEQKSDGDRRPPKAEADDYGVRPGQTAVLHPLDNDSAPEGRLLSIVAVEQPDVPGAQVTISPDGQTLQLSVPDDLRRTTSFEYHIDDGRGQDASARVTVEPRSAEQNEAPALREGYRDRTWRVAHDGTIAVPVLADWRDDRDSDNLLLDSVQSLGGGPGSSSARLTPDGRIRFSAGPAREGGRAQVSYTVSDGHGGVTAREIAFDVQAYDEYTPYAPVAEPDVARGEVGKPITVRPLLNDLPGADPAHPDAVLALGGEVAQQPGVDITSDLETGELTVRAERPGTYFLDYDAAYGNSPLDRNKVRVDVRPRPKSELDPVAMPDTLTVHGQDPAMVDVLANDLDPAGGLLVVERAVAESDQVDVAIVAGRWLRISAADGTLAPNPQVVNYTISNGAVSGVEGQVTLSQKPEPKDATPITAADQVVVRAGGSVTASVLDNDVSPTGNKLSLLTDTVTSSSGELDVQRPKELDTEPGRAFVSGRVVRFVAPRRIEERSTMTVPYVAADESGASATGQLRVTVVPTDAGNAPPEPPQLDGRTVAGGEVTLRIPGSGVDPDGDSVTVTGIDSAPVLGRITEHGANGLVYEAFPASRGTDEFRYTVTDSRGARSTGLARVVVVPPGRPQQPLAVDDRILAAPGRTVNVDAIANDFVGTGEGVEVSLQSPSDAVSYDSGTDLVSIRTPADPQAPSTQVVYAVDNGLDTSLATITVQTVGGHNNPPVVYDAYGVADDSEAVSLDVLEGAYDPDGRVEDLRVVDVFHPTATFGDSRIKVDRTDEPQVVPFRVEDADGGSAVASLYVPATGTGVPYVKDDAFLEVDTNGSVRGRLSDVVVNPSGGPMRLAGRDGAFAAPDQADAEVIDEQTFELSGSSDYIGPGAVLLRVTTTDDDTGRVVTTLLSIPAQIGRPKPVLTCPEVPFEVVQNDEIELDVPSLCNVYTADPEDSADLSYDVRWTGQAAGLELSQPSQGRVVVAASGAARAGTEATLVVTAGDSEPQQIRVRVVRAPAPRLLPVKVPDIKPGESRTIDLAPYLRAGVPDPDPTLLSVQKVGGADASAQKTGDTRVTLRGGDKGGQATFRVVMSDVNEADAGPERRAEGLLQFEVGAVPDAPSGAFAESLEQDATKMRVWFLLPGDNGSPISRYVVQNLENGRRSACAGSGCTVSDLRLGRTYRFKVAAVNKFGQGPWSQASKALITGNRASAPRNIRLVSRASGSVTVGWSAPEDTGGAQVIRYFATVGGKTVKTPDGTTRQATVEGLSNNRRHQVTIVADNGIQRSNPGESPGWHPLGDPASPGGLQATDQATGADRTDVLLGWNDVAANGPGPTRYTLEASRNGNGFSPVPGCSRKEQTSCTHTGVAYDGATWTYRAIAINSPETDNPGGGETPGQSAPSATAQFEAIGTPEAWGAWSVEATGQNETVKVVAPVPDSRGAESTVHVDVSPGGESWSSRLDQGQNVNRTFSTGTNYQVSTVRLRLCNERKCSESQQEVQSYGPIPEPDVNRVDPNKGDQTARWTVSTNGNGRPVTLNYQIDGGQVQTQARGDSPETGQIEFATGGYNRVADLRVWLSDGVRNETRQVGLAARSGQPNDLGVGVAVGAECGGTDQPGCDGRSGSLFNDCNGQTRCNNVQVSVSGWWDDPAKTGDAVRCTVSRGVQDFSATVAGNGTYVIGSFPRNGGTVTASCQTTNNDVDQGGSGSQSWPDDPGNARMSAMWAP